MLKNSTYEYIPEKNTIFCTWNHGFFSNCSVTMQGLINLWEAQIKPDEVNFSLGFSHFKSNDSLVNNHDIYPFFFSRAPDNDKAEFSAAPQLEHHGIYRKQNFSIYKSITKAYFNPNSIVKNIEKNLCDYYDIDFSKTIGVCYRGTDKHTEVDLATPEEYLKLTKAILSIYPDLRVLIQTDQKQVAELFKDSLGDRCFYFKEMPLTSGGHVLHRKDEDFLGISKSEFGQRIVAVTRILSNCEFVINHTGNMAYWICIYRGNVRNVFQFDEKGSLQIPSFWWLLKLKLKSIVGMFSRDTKSKCVSS